MPRHSAQFIQDFLFTNSNNHVEFLKWIQTLDKDDYMLLVYLLERLCPFNHVKHKQLLPFHPYFDAHRLKNPLNVAKAYVALLHLSKHEFNIFEVAYLDPNLSSFYTAIAALVAQWLLVIILALYHIGKERDVPDLEADEENFILVALVCAVSTFIFAKKSVKQWANCGEFIEIFAEMGKPAPYTFLLNRMANQLLSVVVVFYNVYFVMISPDPSEAILNALALFFIIEIDDELVPDWDDEYTDDVKANGFSGYLQHALPSEALYTTITTQGVDVHESASENETHHGPGMYTDDDKLYVDVMPEERKVSVWIGIIDPKAHLTTDHIRIDYFVHGDDAVVEEFMEALKNFKCIRGLKDIMDLCDPTGVSSGSSSSSKDDDAESVHHDKTWNTGEETAYVRRRMIPGGSHYEQVVRPFDENEYVAKSMEYTANKGKKRREKRAKADNGEDEKHGGCTIL